ncbi:hypothetical protein [Gloeothece verrucosa]|uniref:Winged helix-turn-helix transcriptional regulator n=1 Tax=Gloeothece verrucosa (strain PCC 7822) TaxID=497965 RepID=E0UA23_GLOV7|nr:hypothetical protein [Gloeothece verrucosa]ADN16215.1 hypothetical protein Cyan7822_4298 [Gloeothece verrucosa PCC 7822]
MPIQIISATPGPATREIILNLILSHPEGLTLKELSQNLNRPVSMLQICLKSLVADKKISVRVNQNRTQRIYYPVYSRLPANYNERN